MYHKLERALILAVALGFVILAFVHGTPWLYALAGLSAVAVFFHTERE